MKGSAARVPLLLRDHVGLKELLAARRVLARELQVHPRAGELGLGAIERGLIRLRVDLEQQLRPSSPGRPRETLRASNSRWRERDFSTVPGDSVWPVCSLNSVTVAWVTCATVTSGRASAGSACASFSMCLAQPALSSDGPKVQNTTDAATRANWLRSIAFMAGNLARSTTIVNQLFEYTSGNSEAVLACNAMVSKPMSPEERAKVFKALADPRRVEIVELLAQGSQCGTTPGRIPRHQRGFALSPLGSAGRRGILKKERQGQLRVCTLDAERLRTAMSMGCGLGATASPRERESAEREERPRQARGGNPRPVSRSRAHRPKDRSPSAQSRGAYYVVTSGRFRALPSSQASCCLAQRLGRRGPHGHALCPDDQPRQVWDSGQTLEVRRGARSCSSRAAV